MTSITEDNKLKNRSQQGPNSGSNSGLMTASMSTIQTVKKRQDGNNNNNTREKEEATKRTKKRRPTKVGLNDILRRIRHLIVEGRSNLEIQDILQLKERTFYRYMAKIHEIDQALFAEEEKRTMITEIGIFKDRLLDSYRWYIAVADNEKIKVNIRMQARRDALDIALTLLMSERYGLKIIERIQQQGYRLFRDS